MPSHEQPRGDARPAAAVLDGRAGVAGLQALLCGRAGRAALRRRLTDLLPTGAVLGPTRLLRSKFKPGRRLSGWYSATAEGRPRLVAVDWTPPGAPPPGAWASPFEVAEAELHDRGLVGPFTQLHSHDPEAGTRLLVAPLDPSFPHLARLSDPATASALLDGPAEVDVVRYRPGERHVLRYRQASERGPRGGGASPTTLYLKLYRNDESRPAFHLAQRLADRLDEHGGPLVAARPWARLPEVDSVAFPLVAGTPLSRLLQRGGTQTAHHVHALGRGLRSLHDGVDTGLHDVVDTGARDGLDTGLDVRLPARDLAEEARLVARACEQLTPLSPPASALVSDLLGRVQAANSELPPEEPGFAHGDLKCDHLLVHRDRLTLIDFDTCLWADAALDIGKFLADLRWWHTQGSLPDLHGTQAAFLAGYDGALAPDRLARSRLFEVLIFVKIVARRVRVHERDWEDQTLRLLRTAGELVGPTPV
jgi:Ser/Thr protein kinase RdoA (MazF antagonist)